MRSMLFVPGDSEKKLEKGFGAEADVVIVDLEDSVAPHNKEAARAIAAAFIAARRQETGPAVYIRVNDLSTGLTDDDLAALVPARPDGTMLPKSNSWQDVQRLAAKLRVAEAEAGISDGTTRIVPIISETAAGVLAGASYAGASGRLAGLTARQSHHDGAAKPTTMPAMPRRLGRRTPSRMEKTSVMIGDSVNMMPV